MCEQYYFADGEKRVELMRSELEIGENETDKRSFHGRAYRNDRYDLYNGNEGIIESSSRIIFTRPLAISV